MEERREEGWEPGRKQREKAFHHHLHFPWGYKLLSLFLFSGHAKSGGRLSDSKSNQLACIVLPFQLSLIIVIV
jgi:hypothetical protein